jgi:hypothetical protein
VGYKPFVCGLQAVCMRVTSGLYAGYKPFVWSLQAVCMWVTSSLYAGYKQFVCGLQAVCMRVTNLLYGHYKQFVTRIQKVCNDHTNGLWQCPGHDPSYLCFSLCTSPFQTCPKLPNLSSYLSRSRPGYPDPLAARAIEPKQPFPPLDRGGQSGSHPALVTCLFQNLW